MRFKTAALAALDPPPADDADAGEFTALVAVFGNVDSQGERILPGAFKGTLERWGQMDAPIPVLWSHQWADPDLHIGQVLDAAEVDEGLRVKGLLDVAENPKAARVRQLMIQRRVRQFSFAYDVLDAEEGEEGVTDLHELELYEVGPCLVGANPSTELLDAKASLLVPRRPPSRSPAGGAGRGLAFRLRLAAIAPEAVKAAVGPHSTPTSESAWDGPANEARVETDQPTAYYRKVYAWQDPEGDPATKAGWRFIHHEVAGDGTPGAANLTACSTGIGILNGGRGGTTIPAADRQGVYNHLAKHLRDGDREPPTLA